MTHGDQPGLSDEALVGQARTGSRPAFEALVRRYQKALYFLCLRYVHDHDAASDLTQRSFIRVLEKLDDLREDNTFKSWLFRIAANLSLNHIRDHARFVDVADPARGGRPAAHQAAHDPRAPGVRGALVQGHRHRPGHDRGGGQGQLSLRREAAARSARSADFG
jgi:DNA-directed RNA polymerase specialized sigma24 family protein